MDETYERTDFGAAASTWYDVDLPRALDADDDDVIEFVLSRMWLCQMMDDSEVIDYADAVEFLREQLRSAL